MQKKINDTSSISRLKDFALIFNAVEEDFDRYWSFIFEILPMSDLKDDWQHMKTAGVSFTKDL